jgi:hypothetical protein
VVVIVYRQTRRSRLVDLADEVLDLLPLGIACPLEEEV